MARDKLTYASGNSSSTTLSSAITNTDTSAPLTSDTNFSAKSGEGMVIIDEGESTEELAYATGKVGSALTIPLANRGLEGGSAQGHALSASVKGIISAGMWNDVIDAVALLIDKATGAIKSSITFGSITVTGAATFQGTVSGVAAFWANVPGTPTRVSDTQFTITDTSNANSYDLLFKKGVILKWLESTTFQTAMVISSSYSSDAVTINIVGDSLTAGFSAMQYAIPKASCAEFIIAGTFPSAATTNLSKSWIPTEDVYVLSADLYVTTAGSGTGSTVVDINDDGTTKFTTKPTLTTTGTSDIDNVSDNPSTAVAAGSVVTVDVDSVTATTAPSDGYVKVWYYPVDYRYR